MVNPGFAVRCDDICAGDAVVNRAGLDKSSRGASCHRLLLAAYLLGTQSSLDLSRAIPPLISSLVTYMQVVRLCSSVRHPVCDAIPHGVARLCRLQGNCMQ